MKKITHIKFILSHIVRLNRHSLLGFFRLINNKRLIGTLIPKKAIILEAGAHVGNDTAEMARLWPDATIHAFEPVPHLFSKLTQNTSRYPNVYRYQVALSDTSGFQTLHVSQGASDEASSLLQPKEHVHILPTVTFNKNIQVKTITLDTWAKQNKISHIDFMWLDMQGMEYNVLKKSRTIFPKVRLLYTEVNLKENYTGVTLYKKFKKWLIARGMIPKIENIYWKDQGNALFIRNNK